MAKPWLPPHASCTPDEPCARRIAALVAGDRFALVGFGGLEQARFGDFCDAKLALDTSSDGRAVRCLTCGADLAHRPPSQNAATNHLARAAEATGAGAPRDGW